MKINKIKKKEILNDYKIALISRKISILGRKEVLMGKAKFGIFGDGKEIAQLAMAKIFKNGDFRSGYYRDQTFMMAIGKMTIQNYFSQLYSNTNLKLEPSSSGRMMNNHFSTRTINQNGKWKKIINLKNSTADISPNASQMPRLIGLAYASKLFRKNKNLKKIKFFSKNGNEIAFGTIGNAATSEGIFFESINAAGVLQIPIILSIWDDEYGISVPQKYHTTKENISEVLNGFKKNKKKNGYKIFTVKGWEYIKLCNIYKKAEQICRNKHIPIIIHVKEMTQPQGHSTSGSHEKYKSKKRLIWEKNNDCIKKMKQWLIKNKISNNIELSKIEKDIEIKINIEKNKSWNKFIKNNKKEKNNIINIINKINNNNVIIYNLIKNLKNINYPKKLHNIKIMKKILFIIKNFPKNKKKKIIKWIKKKKKENNKIFNSYLYSESNKSALKVLGIQPIIEKKSKLIKGKKILQKCFNNILLKNPKTFIIGEDVGKIGDVNQSLINLQKKYSKNRVTDTGIRESTIIGQGIGASLRGLKPIIEIQYLDYLLYGLQIISDDLCTLQYRTKGGQKSPIIIRTRGHRFQGIWHSGSYISSIINMTKGIYIITPRNMTQAAGFYNTMIESDDSALIIECLKGYELKEKIPSNIKSFKIPLGIPDIIAKGKDITIITYGYMCKIIKKVSILLKSINILCEIIDVQTLVPFDINHIILKSIKKTKKIIFIDEDIPGGCTAYMMQKVIEEQNAYKYLKFKPITISSQEHRPAYSDDGDYFSKPNIEIIFEKIYQIILNWNKKKQYYIYN